MIKPILALMLNNNRKHQRVDFSLYSQNHLMIQDFAKPIRGTNHAGKNRSGVSAKIIVTILIITGVAAFGAYIHFNHQFLN